MTIPSEYFSREEFACKCGCGYDTVDAELLDVLTRLREYWGQPVFLNSGCRCPIHNKKVNGGHHSQHLVGRAADIRVQGVTSDDVAEWLERVFPNKYGIGRYKGRTHIDTRRGKARWDAR